MNDRAACRAGSKSATSKNMRSEPWVFLIPPLAFRPGAGESGIRGIPISKKIKIQ
jgi:hypothetical protein